MAFLTSTLPEPVQPESMMTDMSLSSSVAPKHASRRSLAPGGWLVGIAGLGIFGLGIVLIASASTLPRSPAVEVAGGALSSQAGIGPQTRIAPGAMAIPGFQRRGNTLVGEVVTQDGTSLRLVFDANTKTLIGMRALSPPSGASARR